LVCIGGKIIIDVTERVGQAILKWCMALNNVKSINNFDELINADISIFISHFSLVIGEWCKVTSEKLFMRSHVVIIEHNLCIN
jgi:hemin uptake protein HemP